jgi:hypothetical protein
MAHALLSCLPQRDAHVVGRHKHARCGVFHRMQQVEE